MAHKHSVYDTDKHFSINPITREIKNEASSKIMIMQGDHNSERFTFEAPRYIEGHDMTLCDKTRIHYINLNLNKVEKSDGVYEVDDMQLSPESEEVVIFSWLLSRKAVKHPGSLIFLIEFSCHTGSEIDYEWNTSRYRGISVGEGMDNAEAVLEMYADVLVQWEMNVTNRQNAISEEIAKLKEQVENNSLPAVTKEDEGKRLEVVGGVWQAVEKEDVTCDLPEVTADDNGKFLQVVDGVWTAVAITDGNEVAY